MVVFITGASHTGKTALAQRLLEEYKYPYLSEDHLKMGLIRSGQTELTPEDDNLLIPYLWQIVKEIAKTAIENKQNLIIEGCYIPLDWKKDFTSEYLDNIKFICLVMTENYVNSHYADILDFSDVIEKRLYPDCEKEQLIRDNLYYKTECEKYGVPYILIDEEYDFGIEL